MTHLLTAIDSLSTTLTVGGDIADWPTEDFGITVRNLATGSAECVWVGRREGASLVGCIRGAARSDVRSFPMGSEVQLHAPGHERVWKALGDIAATRKMLEARTK